MKKFLLIILVFAMLTFCFVFLSSCEEEENIPDDVEVAEGLSFEYNKSYGGYFVTGRGKYKGARIVIPSTYKNKPVVGIDKKAFSSDKDLVEIAIPKSVKIIRTQSFENCRSLVGIYVGYSEKGGVITVEGEKSQLEQIDKRVFSYCVNFGQIYYNGTMNDFKSVSKDISAINCWNYETLSITVVCLDGRLVYTWQHGPNNPPEEYPNEPINPNEPNEPGKPDDTSESQGLEFTLNDDGNSYSLTGRGDCNDESIYVPRTYNGKPVTKIGDNAFYRYNTIDSQLKYISIPDSVTAIGKEAFSSCSNLTEIILPDTIVYIEEAAFSWCESLTKITIPDSVVSIGMSAFFGCNSLTSIHIPDSVTNIGSWAFDCCKLLTGIYVDAYNPKYKSIDGNLYSKDGKIFMQYANGKQEKSFNIPGYVVSIADGAFGYSDNLVHITIPASVISIGNWVFTNCISITSIIIPDSVINIGARVFECCDSLVSVTIPGSITSFDEIPIWNYSIQEFYYKGTIGQWYDYGWNMCLCSSSYIVYCSDGTISSDGGITYN